MGLEYIEIKFQKLKSSTKPQYYKYLSISGLLKKCPFFDISLSYSEIKNRRMTIIKIFQNLKTEKIINNKIFIHFKDISKKMIYIEVKDLTYYLLVKISKIY